MGHEEMSRATSASPHPYYRCDATTLEQMQPCILGEDKDLQKYGVKVLVKDDAEMKTKAWDPKKLIILRTDRDEAIHGPDFVSDRIEV